jgi:hypothetical protein
MAGPRARTPRVDAASGITGAKAAAPAARQRMTMERRIALGWAATGGFVNLRLSLSAN